MDSTHKTSLGYLDMTEVIHPGLLEDAVMDGRLDRIARQLAGGLSPNHRSGQFGALVAMAVTSKQAGALDALLAAGAHPDATDGDEVCALSLAAAMGRVDMARSLVEHDASFEPPDCKRAGFPLFAAIGAGKASMLRWLLEQGARVDVDDHNGRTPLIVAARLGHADCARVCLAFGANIDAQEATEGRTAAMMAVNSSADAMRALCEHGFDVSVKTHIDGHTVSDLAQAHPDLPGALTFSAWRLTIAETDILSGQTAAPSSTVRKPRI